MVINLRGTGGSGKTTLCRAIIAEFGLTKDLRNGSPKAYAHTGSGPGGHPLAVVGDYTAVTGGCDGIKTQDEVCARVLDLARDHHVLFEGLLISGLHSRYSNLAHHLRDAGLGPMVIAFLDTPLALCLQRTQQRRDARGAKTPFNPQNTIAKYGAVVSCRAKFAADGHRVVKIPHGDAVQAVLALCCDTPVRPAPSAAEPDAMLNSDGAWWPCGDPVPVTLDDDLALP